MAWKSAVRFLNLNVREKIFSPSRIPSLDGWRGLAILFVVFWHFFATQINFGLLGVQIFFVLSGFLVSRPLVSAFLQNQKIPWKDFVLSRAYRIIPSYYGFLCFGSLFVYAALYWHRSTILIPEEHWLSYWLFFKNYNISNPEGFSHLWSLAVEEHFYILLPLFFIAFPSRRSVHACLIFLIGLLFFGVLIRHLGTTGYFELRGFYFSDPASTHNNFDCLIYGVLIRFAYELKWALQNSISKSLVFLSGLILLIVSFSYGTFSGDAYYSMVLFKTFNSIAISLMIWSGLSFNWKILTPLRVLSFYSYNLYLWHIMALLFVQKNWGATPVTFGPYVAFSLVLAVLSTHLIELNAYKLRS